MNNKQIIKMLTFKNKAEVIKLLENLPEGMVRLLGYVDEEGIIQRFELKDLLQARDEEWELEVRRLKPVVDLDNPENNCKVCGVDHHYNLRKDK